MAIPKPKHNWFGIRCTATPADPLNGSKMVWPPKGAKKASDRLQGVDSGQVCYPAPKVAAAFGRIGPALADREGRFPAIDGQPFSPHVHHMTRDTNPDHWPEHLRPVFAAIGKAMGGKRLHPDVLHRVPVGMGQILADHQVTIEHLSGAAAGVAGNRYEININGPRILGGWSFRSGELEELAGASYSDAVV